MFVRALKLRLGDVEFVLEGAAAVDEVRAERLEALAVHPRVQGVEKCSLLYPVEGDGCGSCTERTFDLCPGAEGAGNRSQLERESVRPVDRNRDRLLREHEEKRVLHCLVLQQRSSHAKRDHASRLGRNDCLRRAVIALLRSAYLRA